jgi:hypothetical protein
MMSSSATEGASGAGCGCGEKDDSESDDVDEDDDDVDESRKRFIYCPRMRFCEWVGFVYPRDEKAAWDRHEKESCPYALKQRPSTLYQPKLSRTVTCCPNRRSGCFFAVRGDDRSNDVAEHMKICQFDGDGEAVDESDFIACHNVRCHWIAFGFYSDGGDATLSFGRDEVAQHKESCPFSLQSSRIRRADEVDEENVEWHDDGDDDDDDDTN